jgi:translation initiation factor 1
MDPSLCTGLGRIAGMRKRPFSGGLVYSTDAGRMCPACRRPIGSCTCATSTVRSRPAGDGVARIRREVGGRGGKTVTVVTGLPLDEAALAALSKRMKAACGTGGTVKAGALEFQGDHREQLVSLLKNEGFETRLAGG